jgi:hypothetical protein
MVTKETSVTETCAASSGSAVAAFAAGALRERHVLVVERLRGRAESCHKNAATYDASGYHGEAMLQRQRAAAYELAAQDAAELLGVP